MKSVVESMVYGRDSGAATSTWLSAPMVDTFQGWLVFIVTGFTAMAKALRQGS